MYSYDRTGAAKLQEGQVVELELERQAVYQDPSSKDRTIKKRMVVVKAGQHASGHDMYWMAEAGSSGQAKAGARKFVYDGHELRSTSDNKKPVRFTVLSVRPV